MLRNIFIVNATQVVVSSDNPQGVFSTFPNYPKTFDSRDYEATTENPNGNPDLALIVAQAEYADRVKQFSLAHNRAMWTVTLEQANGVQIARKSVGAFPDMTPIPPEPTPNAEPEAE